MGPGAPWVDIIDNGSNDISNYEEDDELVSVPNHHKHWAAATEREVSLTSIRKQQR